MLVTKELRNRKKVSLDIFVSQVCPKLSDIERHWQKVSHG